jgi:peptidoglycan hydrolase CwlO-like protein
MRKTTIIVGALLTACIIAPAANSPAAEAEKKEEHKGVTVDDLTRGLKSAGKNIEKEIPKIGPAIGETFKKATGKESKKQSDDASEQPSK